MDIYFIIQQKHKLQYDEYISHVVIANNEKEVISEAKSKAASEGLKVWNDAIITNIGTYTGKVKHPFILQSNYRAG